MRNMFISIAQNYLECLYAVNHSMKHILFSIQGREFLDRALQQGKGVVAFTAHLGNFPLLCYHLVRQGYPIHIIARPLRIARFGKYVNRLLEKTGVKIIWSYPRKQCVAATTKVLRENKIVFIPMDQNFGTGGVWVPFFGRLAATPPGAVVLALRTGAQLLPLYSVRKNIGVHHLEVFPPVMIKKGGRKHVRISETVNQCTQLIEGWIRQFPQQWVWLHKRWKSQPSAGVPVEKLVFS